MPPTDIIRGLHSTTQIDIVRAFLEGERRRSEREYRYMPNYVKERLSKIDSCLACLQALEETFVPPLTPKRELWAEPSLPINSNAEVA